MLFTIRHAIARDRTETLVSTVSSTKTLLVAEDSPSGPLATLLLACDVPFAVQTSESVLLSGGTGPGGPQPLVISEDRLVQAHALSQLQHRDLRTMMGGCAPLLVCPFQGTTQGIRALELLIGGRVHVSSIARPGEYTVADSTEVCGPFAGLRFGPTNGATDRGLLVSDCDARVDYLVAIEGRGLFTRIESPRGRIFVASCNVVFDPGAETASNLQAATHFSSLVPLLMFLQSCGAAIWSTPRRFANLMIDDPNLRPDYGFVNMRALADCVDQLEAAATIGFIPWNYTRTSGAVVDLFLSRWPRLSVCVHGCDHTRSEFSTRTLKESIQLVRLAVERMQRLGADTGLAFEKAMVFPQGIFSAVAMRALRQSDLLAAVNTELVDDDSARGVRASELLKPAITCYSGFPLFLRRKADEPIENFALDLMLGKPCLIVTHHEFFRNGMDPLGSLIRSLNRLDPSLAWTNLETILSRSCSIRQNPNSTLDVRLYSSRTALDGEHLPGTVRFLKSEPLTGKDFEVYLNDRPVECRCENGEVSFSSELPVGRHLVRVEVAPKDAVPTSTRSLKYRLKVSARRHLSEVRDNYVAKSPALATAVAGAQRLIRRSRKPLPRRQIDA